MPVKYADLRNATLPDLRTAIRTNCYQGHTAGLAPGRLQANLAILPAAYALDFFSLLPTQS